MNQASSLSDQISQLLEMWNGGDGEAWNILVPLVYDELHKQAHNRLKNERENHTLQTSAIVHETYVKLTEQRQVNWENRAHFFWLASEIMRRILVDYARGRNRQKRGGNLDLLTLNSALQVAVDRSEVDLLALHEALTRLAQKDNQQAKIVELRYFCGCSIRDAAETLGISAATVKRDWAVAKAWLRHQLNKR